MKFAERFKPSPDAKPPPVIGQDLRVFGVSLQESIRYANSAISLRDTEGRAYVYGYVPIPVAKIGVWLKEQGKHMQPFSM